MSGKYPLGRCQNRLHQARRVGARSNLGTITLLLGMMIVVASLRLSDFFASPSPGHGRTPSALDPAWRDRRASAMIGPTSATGPRRQGEFGVGDVREAADHAVLRVAGDRRGRSDI
jgi:hypothetical protein